MMKKVVIGLIFIICLFVPAEHGLQTHAATRTNEEEMIFEEIETRLEEIDLSGLERYYEENVTTEKFKQNDLKEMLKKIISGETAFGVDEMVGVVVSSISLELPSVLKLVSLVVIIAGFGAFSDMLKSAKEKSGVGSIINFIMLLAVLSVVTTITTDFITETLELLKNMRSLSETVFPILISLVVALGGVNTTSTIEPAVVFLTSGVTTIISSLTSFAVIAYFVLSVIGELTEAIKLDQMKSLVSSVFKWGVGLVFTIFMGYMSINGIIGAGRDGLTIKTAKYALKNYIPMVGGYLSDSYELFRVGSELIKNSVGIVGVILLFGMAIKKVINLSVYKFGFMLASGITEPFGTKKITRFLSSLSTLFNFLIVGIAVSFLMIVITIFVLMTIVGA